MGSGVVVGPGRVLTASYIVMGATEVQITGVDGRPFAATRIALDHDSGLAVVSFRERELPHLVPDPEPLNPGAIVMLLAASDRTERRGAYGHVISANPFETFWEYMLERALLTTAGNPGLAGAALLDPIGRLRGLVTLGLVAVGRQALAIPIDQFTSRSAELEEKGYARSWPRRAWLGLFSQGVEDGVAVTGLVASAPAEQAGLTRGDLILTADGEPVRSLRQLYSILWRRTPGETIDLKVLRDSAIQVISVVAADRYEFYG